MGPSSPPSNTSRRFVRLGLTALAGLHILLAGYVSWIIWLLTEWSAGAAGARVGRSFWIEQASWSLAAALALGVGLYLLNQLLFACWPDAGGRRRAAWMAAGAGAFVLVAGVAAGLAAAL